LFEHKDTQDTKIDMDDRTEQAASRVIGAAIEVHQALGAGYLESVYEQTMAVEMEPRGIPFQKQLEFGLKYKGHIAR
jgi:GxxExxY protein